MVKFLVEHGADIEACDNEGWTALHATASCGFIDIARYITIYLLHAPCPEKGTTLFSTITLAFLGRFL